MANRHNGRPVRYERDDAYVQWQRTDRSREEYAEREIVEALSGTLDQIEEFRARFDADGPDEVSFVNASQGGCLHPRYIWAEIQISSGWCRPQSER